MTESRMVHLAIHEFKTHNLLRETVDHMGMDVGLIRKDFPILDRKLPNGKQLVYFDNAATSQKPQCVIDAMSEYYSEYNSNAHRANHTLADEATTALEGARNSISSFLGPLPKIWSTQAEPPRPSIWSLLHGPERTSPPVM